jgi:hypothetical protein
MIAMENDRGDVASGVQLAQSLLGEPQAVLANGVSEYLGQAVARNDEGDASAALQRLRDAVTAAREYGYL